MLEKVFGKDSPSLTAVLNNLSRLNLILGNQSEAESFIQRSLSILQKTYGEDHLVIACGLNRLGELRMLQGTYEQAEFAFTRSLEIMDKRRVESRASR
jgi:tetratricopeptide (TPR) repeat protein